MQEGHRLIAGLDEAGRGAWAGPVVSAAVILPLERFDLASILDGVRDSKQLTPNARERWWERIAQVAADIGVGSVAAIKVDELGLLPATRLSMTRALQALNLKPTCLLIDHIGLEEVSLPQSSLVRGDARSLSIAAASIIAKVARDRRMVELNNLHQGYGFDHHKGYGTLRHREALQLLGPSPIHRKSFQPVAARLNEANPK
jgi:ribonuclease HII